MRTGKGEVFPAFVQQGPSIPSLHAQRLPMGPKYNVATCVEELKSTNSYLTSKHPRMRAEVPNLAQAAKSELLVAVKWRQVRELRFYEGYAS